MIKVDLRKVYDSVEWPFLHAMLLNLGFPLKFVDWVMACVTIVSYSILINGKPTTPVKQRKVLVKVTHFPLTSLLLGWNILLDE